MAQSRGRCCLEVRKLVGEQRDQETGQFPQLGPNPPEPDGEIHLCMGGSRCQAGSGGAQGLLEALLRAEQGLTGSTRLHGACEAGEGGG